VLLNCLLLCRVLLGADAAGQQTRTRMVRLSPHRAGAVSRRQSEQPHSAGDVRELERPKLDENDDFVIEGSV